jgi:putative dehydrogenase
MSDTRPVAIIGLGLMGEVYARRLLDAGVSVTGYDIDATKRARLKDMGGSVAESIEDLAADACCVLIAVFSTDQVEDVIENHLLPALGEGSRKIVMCASTCDPDRIAALADRVMSRGIRFLDTPVSGASDQVRRGDGVCLIGGDETIAAEVAPLLDILFGRRFHVGKVGDGGRAKLAVNLILALNRGALAEGLVLAERLGLDPAKFLEVAKGSASQSHVMEIKGPKMVSGDFSPQGYVHQSLKDTKLMLAQAKAHGQRLSMLEIYYGMMQACVDAGEAELDNSAIINEVRRRGLARK